MVCKCLSYIQKKNVSLASAHFKAAPYSFGQKFLFHLNTARRIGQEHLKKLKEKLSREERTLLAELLSPLESNCIQVLSTPKKT